MRSGRLAIAVVAVVGLAACGSGGGTNAGKFSESIDGICRSLEDDLLDLDEPGTLDEMGAFADDASQAFASAVSSLKKLEVPGGSSTAIDDAKALVSNMDHQVDLLDGISAAAGSGDQATVDSLTGEFDTVLADNAELAGGIGASRCAFDPLFGAIAPVETTVPATDPVVTEPVITDPPQTDPPETDPPATDPLPEDSNKTHITLADSLSPNGGFTFVDVTDDLLDTFETVLFFPPQTSAQAGQIGGVETIDSSGSNVARVFVFLPDQGLPYSALEELIPTLAAGAFQQPVNIGGLNGVLYEPEGGGFFFIASNDVTSATVIVWAIAESRADLDAGVGAFVSGLGG